MQLILLIGYLNPYNLAVLAFAEDLVRFFGKNLNKFREHKRRVEVQTDGDGKHLSYKQRIRYEFDPEASNGTENDLFNIPNIPLIVCKWP